MSIADVSTATKLRSSVIERIEAERWDLLHDEDVFIRAHLKSIAQAVGLDPVSVLDEYAQLGAEPLPEGTPATPPPTTNEPRLDIFTTVGKDLRPPRPNRSWLFVALSLIAIVVLAGWVRLAPNNSNSPSPSISNSSSESPSASASPSGSDSAKPTSPTVDPAVVTVQLKATGKSWVQVTAASGEVLQKGIVLNTGADLTFIAADSITVKVGNAGAVSLIVNGYDIGAMGSNGQVVTRSFGLGDPSLNQ